MVEVMGHLFRKGEEVACLLGAANRDTAMFEAPAKANLAFGSGLHSCVGAPLARLELQIALPILFERLAGMQLSATPKFGNLYHFHRLEALTIRR